jgi:hypothetical protein
MDVIFDETLGKVHNEERKFQFSGDVFKVEADEFINAISRRGQGLYVRRFPVLLLSVL